MRATDLDRALEVLRASGVVAFPTESSYGLAADALSLRALERLAQIKGERADRPPPLLVDGPAMLHQLVSILPQRAQELIDRFWPGPLTLVLPAKPYLPTPLVSDGFVGVRQSPHPIAQALVHAFARPITATSANRTGHPPAHSASAATLPGVECILDGGPTSGAPPSTVARVHPDGRIELLRPGPVELL